MPKDPAVLFYTSDFLSGTFTMTNEQVGMYIRLLCVQHQKGMLSEQDMLSICPNRDLAVWSKFDFKDGFYINNRMYSESEKRRNFTESRKKNLVSKSKKSHMESHMDSHMENENENENEIVNELIKVKNPFSEFFTSYWLKWKEYKAKEHKFKYKSEHSENSALNDLFKLSSGNEQTAIAIINQSISNGWKGFFELKNQTNVKPTRNSGAYQLLEQLKRENGF